MQNALYSITAECFIRCATDVTRNNIFFISKLEQIDDELEEKEIELVKCSGEKLYIFVTDTHQSGALMRPNSYGRLQALLANNILGWK